MKKEQRSPLAKFESLYNQFNLSFTCLDKVNKNNSFEYFFLFSSIAGGTTTTTVPQIGPAPVGPQPAPSGAPHIVYVPRNVYVPVIKPVFVPRERKLFF